MRNRIRIQDPPLRMDKHQHRPVGQQQPTVGCTWCACNDVQLSVRVNARSRVDTVCSLWFSSWPKYNAVADLG